VSKGLTAGIVLIAGSILLWLWPTEPWVFALRCAAVYALVWESTRWLARAAPRWLRWLFAILAAFGFAASLIWGRFDDAVPLDRAIWTGACCGALIYAAIWEWLPRRTRERWEDGR